MFRPPCWANSFNFLKIGKITKTVIKLKNKENNFQHIKWCFCFFVMFHVFWFFVIFVLSRLLVYVGLWFEPLPPPSPKNVSLRGGPGADKNEGGEVGRDPPPPKKMSVWGGLSLTFPNVKKDAGASTKALWGGPGLTFPNVKNDAGKHKSTKKSVFFWRRRRPLAGDVFTKRKKTLTFLCLLASFLTFEKVNPGPLSECFCACPGVLLDIREGQRQPPSDWHFFFWGGPSPPPPPSFLSAPGPLRLTFCWAGGVPPHPPPHFCQRRASPLRLTFFGPPPPPPELFLTLGKVKCHRHLWGGGGGGSDWHFLGGERGSNHKPTKARLFCALWVKTSPLIPPPSPSPPNLSTSLPHPTPSQPHPLLSPPPNGIRICLSFLLLSFENVKDNITFFIHLSHRSSSRGSLCVFFVMGQRGRLTSEIGEARLFWVRDQASSCSRGWVVQVTGLAWTRFECVKVGLEFRGWPWFFRGLISEVGLADPVWTRHRPTRTLCTSPCSVSVVR